MASNRVAFLLPNMRGGGAERVALTLIRHFLDRGYAVDLVLMRAEGELLPLVPPEVEVVDLAITRVRSLVGPLATYLARAQPVALQVSMWPLTIAAIVARMLGRSAVRLVISDHAVLSDHYSGLTRWLVRITVRIFYPWADSRVAVSRGAAVDLAQLSGLPAERFTVIHNPVDFPATVETTPEVEAMWNGAQTRILTIGHLKEEKDQSLLVRAFARLPLELDARLVIAGRGDLLGDLKRISRDLGVGDRVLFPGHVANPWPYYASADLFVLPSREESFGVVLVEALYAGLRVVSTASVGALEVLDRGRYGILTDRADVEALARAMCRALEDRPDPAAARRRALHLSGERSIAAYSDVLLGPLSEDV